MKGRGRATRPERRGGSGDMDEVRQGMLPDGMICGMVDGVNKHRAEGYDLTFSAPKSVSVMALVGKGDVLLMHTIRPSRS